MFDPYDDADIIEIDKAFYGYRYHILRLEKETIELKKELKILRNRSDDAYNPPDHSLIIKKTKGKLDLTLPIEKWSTPYFIRYFQECYHKKYGAVLTMRDNGWKVHSYRIAQFRRTNDAMVGNNKDYKELIDWLFASKASKKFILTFGCITSDAFLHQWFTTKKMTQRHTSPEKFKEMAANAVIPKLKGSLDEALNELDI